MRAAYGVTPAAVYELVHVCQARAVRPHINVLAAAILCTAATVGTASAHAVCRGTDPRCYHDWAKDKREGNRVLIYTRTAGPRHSNLGPPLAAGRNPGLDPSNVVQTSLRTWLGRAGIEAAPRERHQVRDGRDPVLYEVSGARREVSANSPSESVTADRFRRRADLSSRRRERARCTARHIDWHRSELSPARSHA
jgi:hypothetical protein